MGRLDMIHIDRSKRAEAWNKVAEQGTQLMAQGIWVIMFPEGTRTPRGGQGQYKIGALRGWPSPPACQSCPSPWLRPTAGRARASCCARA